MSKQRVDEQAFNNQLVETFDLVKKDINDANIYYLSSLSDNEMINEVIKGLYTSSMQHLMVGSISKCCNLNQAVQGLMSGQSVLFLNDECYLIESRKYPQRSEANCEIEKSIRGSNDAFVENILLNVGMIRRRLRNPHLCFKILQSGKNSHNDIVYCYVDNKVKKEVLTCLENSLKNIECDDLMNEKQLIEAIFKTSLNPYPHVRYSERGDLCALHLIQGSIVLLLDNVACGIIFPTTYFEQCRQMEEYTQTTFVAFFTRLIRFIGIFMSLYLQPLWIAIVMDKLVTKLDLEISDVRIGVFAFGILLAEVIVEWIRMSLIHTPTSLSNIMGFIAVFILGDMAIELKAYSKEVLLMIALSNIGTLLTPSYELSMANKLSRIMISILALLFGVSGLCLGILIHFSILLNTKSIYYPYLYPYFPFCWYEIKRNFGFKVK